jgi:hypothetical protein
MIDELFGSDAATSTRPEKLFGAGFPGAGPIGVHLLALKMIDGEAPIATRSMRNPIINRMETEKTIRVLGLHINKVLGEYLVGMTIGVSILSKADMCFHFGEQRGSVGSDLVQIWGVSLSLLCVYAEGVEAKLGAV